MKLTIQQATKNEFGVYELDVQIDGKQYKYKLTSEFEYNKVMHFYHRGYYGRCLNILKGS